MAMPSNQSTDFSTAHRIPTSIIVALGFAATALGQANEPTKPLVAKTPRVPAIGIELAAEVHTQLREAIQKATQSSPASSINYRSRGAK